MSTEQPLGTLDELLTLLEQHQAGVPDVLNLVPSENAVSTLAKLPLLLDVYHRYFFNVSEAGDGWNFRGSQDVAALETRLTLPLLRELTTARFVNARPLSGLSGMAMVLSALGGGRGARVLTVDEQQGGHYATRSLAARLGLETSTMGGPDAHTIDYDGVATLLRQGRPNLVYVDQSNCLFPLDVERLVAVTRRTAPDTLVHVDCSHWLGLVLGGALPNPLALGADSFGGSTHKTFPGPHKAIVATNREDLAQRFYQAQYEMISSHHFGATIGLGIALLEFKECGGARYAATVVSNAQALGRALHARGLDVVAAERGFTGGHQLWIRSSSSALDAHEASDRLYRAGLRVNALPNLPGIPEPALRVGIQEGTYLGLVPEDMPELADIFADAMLGLRAARELALDLRALRHRRQPPFQFATHDPQVLGRLLRLVACAFDPRERAELHVADGGAATAGVKPTGGWPRS